MIIKFQHLAVSQLLLLKATEGAWRQGPCSCEREGVHVYITIRSLLALFFGAAELMQFQSDL